MKRSTFGLMMLLTLLTLSACESKDESPDKEVIKSANEVIVRPNGPSNLTWLVREADEENCMEVVLFDDRITPENYEQDNTIESVSLFAQDADKTVDILIETDFANGKECANVQYTVNYTNGPTDTINSYIKKLHFVSGGVSFMVHADDWLQELFIQNADMDNMTCTVKYVDNCFESVKLKVVSKDTKVEYLDELVKNADSLSDEDLADYGIGLLRLPLDEQYFCPKSEDYMYVITYNYVEDRENAYQYGELISQHASLISFDEAGNCIQYVMRTYDLGIDMTPDCYFDEFNKTYDDGTLPYCKRDYTFNFKLQAIMDAGDNPYYLSKPLTSKQTCGKAIYSKSDVFLEEYESLLNELGYVGDDYYIMQYHYHEDESVSNFLIGYENYEPVNQKVRNYGELDYENVFVYAFDADGLTSYCVNIYVFANEAGIDDWLKKQYGAYYDGGYVGDYVVDASLPPNFKFEDTVYTGRIGNLLYRVDTVSKNDAKEKWTYQVRESEKERYYFSKQNLTDKQVENAIK